MGTAKQVYGSPGNQYAYFRGVRLSPLWNTAYGLHEWLGVRLTCCVHGLSSRLIGLRECSVAPHGATHQPEIQTLSVLVYTPLMLKSGAENKI